MGWYTWPGGREYGGRYNNDKKHGFGIFKWPDGRRYEGFWVHGKQSGQGRYTTKTGNAKVGEWDAGRRIKGDAGDFGGENFADEKAMSKAGERKDDKEREELSKKKLEEMS